MNKQMQLNDHLVDGGPPGRGVGEGEYLAPKPEYFEQEGLSSLSKQFN